MGCGLSNGVELEWPAGWVCSDDDPDKERSRHRSTQKTVELQTRRPHPYRTGDEHTAPGRSLQGSGGANHHHHQHQQHQPHALHLHRSPHDRHERDHGGRSNIGLTHASPASPYVSAVRGGGGRHRDHRRQRDVETPRSRYERSRSSKMQRKQSDRHRRHRDSTSRSRDSFSARRDERDRRRRQSMTKTSDDRARSDEEDDDQGPVVLTTKYKLLLLGSGESGKSTFFKRMLIQYGRGYSDEERMDFRDSIHDNTVEAMQILVTECTNSDDPDWQIDDSLKALAEEFISIELGQPLTRDVAKDLVKLWADDGICEAFKNRSSFTTPVPDGAEYFFEDVNRLARRGYIPTAEDVLRCRDRTIGVQSEALGLSTDELQAQFEIFDVGGQKSERKAWIKVFTGVHAVLFIVALSEFNMHCFEATDINRMEDSLEVFKMVANSKQLNVPIVLIFNKVDLFEKKLAEGVEFDFHDYDGPQTSDAIKDFLVNEFTSQCTRPDRAIMPHFTCAIERQFNADELLLDVIDVNGE